MFKNYHGALMLPNGTYLFQSISSISISSQSKLQMALLATYSYIRKAYDMIT